MKPLDLNWSPSNPLSCETAIMTDVAEVNPTVTGTDIKSIRTPVLKNIEQYNLKYLYN